MSETLETHWLGPAGSLITNDWNLPYSVAIRNQIGSKEPNNGRD
jgi:hypothetical protein